MIKVSAVIKHIEKLYKVELTEIQVDFLKHVIKGDVIYTPRCFGRSMIYNGYADYLINVVGKSVDYSVSPVDFDKVYTYKDIPRSLLSYERLMEFRNSNPTRFTKEYECKYMD